MCLISIFSHLNKSQLTELGHTSVRGFGLEESKTFYYLNLTLTFCLPTFNEMYLTFVIYHYTSRFIFNSVIIHYSS